MKDIVKYDNKFNLTNLNKLDKVEMDIFMTICSAFSTHQVEEVEYDYLEVKKKAQLSNKKYSDERFKQFMLATQEKILNTLFTYSDDKGTELMPLFSRFYTPKNTTRVKAKLNPEFAKYLYDIPEKISFTKFELVNFLTLGSKYSKTLFRFLLQNYKGIWTIDFKDFKEKLDFPSSYKTSDIIKKINAITEDINNTAIITDLEYTVHQNKAKRGNPIESITFTYKIAQTKGQQYLEPSIITEEKIHKETVVTPSDNPLYDSKIEQVQHIERIEHRETCPRCGGQVFTSVVKSGSNQGRQYKVCENSKYHRGNPNTACNYYEWIENEPPIEQDQAIAPPESATINFNSSGLTNELNITPITGHEDYKPVAAPPEFTAKLQELRGKQTLSDEEKRKKELLTALYNYSKAGIMLGSPKADSVYRLLYSELIPLLTEEEENEFLRNSWKYVLEYSKNNPDEKLF